MPQNETFENMEGVISGWGSLMAKSKKRPNILQYVRIPILAPKSCGLFRESRITDSMLCAGGQDKDACQGDSGGPIVYRRSPGVSQETRQCLQCLDGSYIAMSPPFMEIN